MDQGNINKIFLSTSRRLQNQSEKRLLVTLQRAGFSISNSTLPSQPESNKKALETNTDDSEIINQEIKNSTCSIHFIGKTFFEYRDGMSMNEYHFNKARERIEADEKYKTFIWMPGRLDDSDADKKQLDFINRMQHHLSNNMILSRVPSAIQFVEDVRIILDQQLKKEYVTEPSDVFLISNQTDEKEASRIHIMLSGILKLVKLIIVQDSDFDYEEYASQQMNVSGLSVIYYKNAADWALPFVQQIWKKAGGASSKSPILFIADAAGNSSGIKKFSAPRVTSMSLPHELIPLEIKVQFDAAAEKK